MEMIEADFRDFAVGDSKNDGQHTLGISGGTSTAMDSSLGTFIVSCNKSAVLHELSENITYGPESDLTRSFLGL